MGKIKTGKAAGADEVPPELWKILSSSQDAMTALLLLMNQCWREKTIPSEWRTAKITTIFKKGDDALPSNYRPISLLCLGYKVLAMLLLQRLKCEGCEKQPSATQYGFRSGRSTREPTMLLQALISEAVASRGGSLSVVLLDWEKAFDKLSPAGLIKALKLFGIPTDMVATIQGIYLERNFVVEDSFGNSGLHSQKSGIAQGCPLSPYLFIIALSVVTATAREDMLKHNLLSREGDVQDVTYANDAALASGRTRSQRKST